MGDRKKLIISLSLVFFMIFIVFIYISAFIQPKIIFNAKINNISDEDYKRILNNAQVISQDKAIEKFKHVDIDIKVITPLGLMNNVSIQRDLLHKYLNNDDEIQILGGGSFEHGNGKEYAENIEIYLKDASEQELRTMLRDFKIKVKWNKDKDKIFYLKDYLK